jgi:hypothetical protein
MNTPTPSRANVLDVLHRASALHARQRAALFLLRSLIWLVAAIPLLLLADVLFHFSETPRLAGGVGWIIALLVCLVFATAMALFSRAPVLRIARLLESRNPQLGSKLMNILQLDEESRAESAAPLTRELARLAIEDAEKSLDLPALPPLARESTLPRRRWQALSAVAILTILSLVGGHHVRQQWLRFLDPYGDHPPFSLTRLDILQPAIGEKVLYGASRLIEVRASGHQPKELFLTAKPVGGFSANPITLPLAPRGDGTFVTRLENIREPLELTAHKADGSTRSHRRMLDVVLTPQIGTSVVRIEPPAYTGQPPREIPYRFTALQLLEGTRIIFRVASNRPPGNGSLMFECEGEETASTPLAPLAEGPPDAAVASFDAMKSGRFTFAIVDVDGNAANEKPSASLTITRDLAPAIAITVPEQDAMIVEGLALPVIVDATDDYGLRSVRLHIGLNDTFQQADPVTFGEPDTRRHRLNHTLDLAELGARAGDRIVLFAEAVDTRPEPQLARTATRRMIVITEAQYNDHLREQADVAMIAGKYEDLLDRFERQVAEQRRIEEKLAELRNKAAEGGDKEEILSEFAKAYADQKWLNEDLANTADEMENFGRDHPVYDFEKELHDKLRDQAEKIRESVKQQQADSDKAIEKGPPPPESPDQEMLEDMEMAAREQSKRLGGESERANGEVRESLKELADLHELMKDFKRFEQLAGGQRDIAEQSKAYQDKETLNAEDRLAMRELGARQRDLAQELQHLSKKLRQDAEAAKEKLPEAAASAEKLAEAIDDASMPGLARQAAQSMLESKAADAHAQADKLREEMERLMEDAGQPGQQGLAMGLDRALRLQRGMNPGDSFRQMMLSNKFRGLPGEGGSAAGMGGLMAMGAMDGNPMLLGGESLMDGPIADAIAGRGDGGGQGSPGAPTARIDRPDHSNVSQPSARRTSTPDSGTLLLQYETIADAYFRRLTTKP